MLFKCKQFAICFVHKSPIQCSLITNRRLCYRFPSTQKPENLPPKRNFKIISFHRILTSILQCEFVYLHSLTSFLFWDIEKIKDGSCYWTTWGSLLWRLAFSHSLSLVFLIRLTRLRYMQLEWIHKLY